MSLKSLTRVPMAAIDHREMELQIVRFKPPSKFKLPDDWVVEERPRAYKPSQVDRYYYEPGTRRQFRSLAAVQKYLTGETKDYVATERMVSKNQDPSGVKSGTGKRSACGVTSHRKSATRLSSVAKEEGITRKAFKFSVQSTPTKTDSQRKFNLGKNDRGSIHNLSRPPAKVSWVLSGPGSVWSPFVDGTVVSESEKLKWSEAFLQGVIKGPNS